MSLLNKIRLQNKTRLLGAAWALVAFSWLTMFIVIFISETKSIEIAVTTFAAVTTEAAIWCTAAVLGVSIAEGRKVALRTIKNKLLGKSRQQS
ncbi:hypothetical protein [Pseudoalteromonas sp. Of7M-16]|uniref:hypothetical protein n=1 Tax=Pseudoalteromonas sp. Of7M-16 TaxID=2917756 RepID=UPI001EF60630|nr:hypothetical protein [Pseudoalteromonas sp. Of7M-16]MCG7550065.1 hypothetical protein [Pseudoalteromonas sp. Of7M-16]